MPFSSVHLSHSSSVIIKTYYCRHFLLYIHTYKKELKTELPYNMATVLLLSHLCGKLLTFSPKSLINVTVPGTVFWSCWPVRLYRSTNIIGYCQCYWLLSRMWQEDPITEDTPCLNHRTWRCQSGAHLEASSLLASLHSAKSSMKANRGEQ